jgi:zinc transporter 1/2/3
LFIALTFHQFFEGIALSSVVMDTSFANKKFQTMVMVAFYSLTTPIGIAIGIGIASSFNSNDASALIAQGVLDAVAAGILLFDGLVNVVVPHFRGPKFAKDPAWFQVAQFVCFWLGAAVMALIGKWA